MGRKQRGLAEIVQHYHQANRSQFRPENFLEIPRIFGNEAAIDMNRLVCQHQQHVASAYMRRIRRDKIKQRDVYFQKLQNIPLKIRRMAVSPGYVDPYSKFKLNLPKLGQDDKIQKEESPRLAADDASPYVPHNSLSPHLNVLFKMNPTSTNPGITQTQTNGGKKGNVEDDLPFPLSPRKGKQTATNDLPAIKKRISVGSDKRGHDATSGDESTPRCPTNSPRNAAFWNFTIPKELGYPNQKKRHVSSIPRGKEALAAIRDVQKHNKPLPAISTISTKA